MIVTVTPNPSLDRTIHVGQLRRGEVLRAADTTIEPSGKGVNVSLALAASGIATTAVLPVGGYEGRELAAMLAERGLDHIPVPVAGRTRSNVSVVEPDGVITKLNEPGPRLETSGLQDLLAAVDDAASEADWVVAGGTLPPGSPDDLYARLTGDARSAGRRVAVDAGGPPLDAAVRAAPTLVAPNLDELAELVGRPLRTVGDVVAAAVAVRERGAAGVLASAGADGAVLMDATDVHHGEVLVGEPRNAVGAGDALLAGFLAGGGEGPDALEEGLAHAAGAVLTSGTHMPAVTAEHRKAVRLHPEVDRHRVLAGAASGGMRASKAGPDANT